VSTIFYNRRASDRLENRLEFETLIADLSSRFINLPPAGVDAEIQNALRRVSEFLDVDQAMVWQWSLDDPDLIEATHYFPAPDGLPAPGPMKQEHYPWIRGEMLAGRVVVIPSVEDMPEVGAVDRESGLRFGVKSNLSLPLSVGGESPIGVLALNTLRAKRDWPDALVARLQLIAQVFTNALARRRHELAMQASEERLTLAADAAGAGLWTYDYASRLLWATDRARAIFGFPADEVLTFDRFESAVHPDDRERVRDTVERSRTARSPIDIEYRIVRDDGEVRWVASRGRPQQTTADEPARLMGLSVDITERKRIQDAFRKSEARLAAGADLAGLGFYEVDFTNGGVVFADDRFREITGYSPDLAHDRGLIEFWLGHVHPDDRQRVLDIRQELMSGIREKISIEYRYVHPTHGERWLHHESRAVGRDADGGLRGTYGVLRDITEARLSEEALRELSEHLIRAHEEERALLARELHDDVTQRLAVLAIDVGRTELAAGDGPHSEPMRALREGLIRLSEDIHTMAYQLHPSVLEELGLEEALRTECERVGRRNGIAISLDLDPTPAAIGKDASFCLFRVAQEALNNVTRHAGARTATVTMRRMDAGLLLEVRDDGVGFDPERSDRRKSLGLASMRERVRLVRGTLEIESAPGSGTAIIVWVPGGGSGQ
jgi:PAS domain S-box-containing protein